MRNIFLAAAIRHRPTSTGKESLGSDTYFRACTYLDCTTGLKGFDKGGDAAPKMTIQTEKQVRVCEDGPSEKEAVANLKKKIAGIPQGGLDVVCTPNCDPVVREHRSLFGRISAYLNSRDTVVCQDFAVTRTVQVAYDGVHDFEVYRPELVTKDERFCAEGPGLGEAKLALDKTVSEECENDGVSCLAKGDATVSVKKSILEKVGGFMASLGDLLGSASGSRRMK